MRNIIHTFICKLWEEETVPEDWVNAILVAIFKNKGLREECGNYRGISLLVSAGKILAGVLLNRLNNEVAKHALPESQCGFRANRGTLDMIFTARQIQEKCQEQQMDLYQAFDTVHRKSLWIVLKKLGCPEKFVSMIKALHDGMKAWVNINGELTEPIDVENGVKQGDILGPTLFSLYFAMVFKNALKNCKEGVFIRYRTSGRLMNLKRFSAKSKVLHKLIQDLLYADDCDLVTHIEADMQHLMDLISKSCKAFGLTISIPKTEVMYQPAPGNHYVEPIIFVEGVRLKVVDKFTYLGSTLNRFATLDDEITARIQKAALAFKSLEDRAWSKRSIKKSTKVKIYSACVLTALLYACETWSAYKKHVRILERFHQRCLRRIMNVHWQTHTPDTEILDRSGLGSIESLLHRHRLRWVGNLIRMPDFRIPKQVLYGELVQGKRPQHKPKLRYKDSVRTSLKAFSIAEDNWEATALDQVEWDKLLVSGSKVFETSRTNHQKLKRAVRKRENVVIPINTFVCEICSRVCLSKAGLKSHIRTHKKHAPYYYDIASTVCTECSKVCKSVGGLKRHMRIHGIQSKHAPAVKTHTHATPCNICGKHCKSVAGLKSHLRSHIRKGDK